MPYPVRLRVGAHAASPHCWHEQTLHIVNPEAAAPPHEFRQYLADGTDAYRPTVIAELAENAEGVVVLARTGDADREQENTNLEKATLAALYDPTVRVVAGGRLGATFEKELCRTRGVEPRELDPDRICEPDMLIVVERDGDGTPVQVLPAIVRWHAETDGEAQATLNVSSLANPTVRYQDEGKGHGHSEDLLILAHHWRHLDSLGLVRSENPTGAVAGTGRRLVWFALDKATVKDPTYPGRNVDALTGYDRGLARHRDVVDAAEAVRDYVDGAHVATGPAYNNATCSMCPFWKSTCEQSLRHDWPGGHVSMLAGISPAKAMDYYEAGVFAARDLASLDVATAEALAAGADVDDIVGADADTVERFADSRPRGLPAAILQARVVLHERVCRRPGVDMYDLRRADVEVDFDLENTPAGRVYLWGSTETVRTPREKQSAETTFATFDDDDAGEAATFADFWAYLTASRDAAHAAGKTWRGYHYSHHEKTMMGKLAAKHADVDGVPTEAEVAELFNSGDIVDLYAVVRKLMWPTKTMSLKDTAGYARFAWDVSGANGAASLTWYARAVAGGDDAEQMRERLLGYVLDDVKAQWVLREMLESFRGLNNPQLRIPAAMSLPPAPKRW